MSLTILILSLFTSNLYAAGNGTLLTVKLVDALDGLPMSNVRVYAFQRLSDNSLQWYQNKTSDSNGQIDFDLQGIDNGGAYVFKTQRLDESGWVVSGDVKNAGSYTFYVRNVRINAVNGLNDSALTGHEIHAYQRDSNNHDTWFASAETNASGVVDFSLPDLASGQRYIFKSRSPVDNAVWYVGEEIYQSSTSTFVIGNKPLSVELVNNADQQPIANFEVSAYKRLPDNSLKWVQKQTSNVNGRVTFDLQGLGNGTVYVLEAKQEQGRNWARSDDLNNTGNYAFNIRNIRVTVVNGLNDKALTGHKIHAFKRDVNGDDSWFSASTTSASGLADFFLPGLTTGQRYVFKSLSPVDNTTWYTGEEINQSGVSNFVVGNALLELKLVNSLSQQSIANVDVTAYQRLPDNSFKWFQRKTTDSKGRIKFDLDGLGDNHQYILRASPYGIKISSKNIVDTGEFIMEAGRVAVTLRRKIDGSVLVGKKLQLLEKVAPGVFEWRASSITDQNGLVRFDPEGLDEGNVFVIYGQNFLGSNYRYYSHWVTSKGALEFVVDLD
ncbi:MAG: hypothetical protein KAR12_06545, partial [Methylococcales bacterium]|nr:hypothetical protein [Methylococcales bacterium]